MRTLRLQVIPLAVVAALASGCGQTDAGITTDVKARLAADETVKAYQVDVDTQDGVVTLTGDVETMAAREQAVRIARETEGVRDVIDNLRVGEAAPTTGVDIGADIDTNVDDAAERDARDAAGAVGEAAGDAGRAVKEGAQDVGERVRDAVRDDK